MISAVAPTSWAVSPGFGDLLLVIHQQAADGIGLIRFIERDAQVRVALLQGLSLLRR